MRGARRGRRSTRSPPGSARVRDGGGRLFILGVGGSAGHASHAVNDFRKICGFEAYAPTDNVSELTARVNDEGWDTSFAEWLKVSRLEPRDALLVFSVGGGNREKNVSANLVRAARARARAGRAPCSASSARTAAPRKRRPTRASSSRPCRPIASRRTPRGSARWSGTCWSATRAQARRDQVGIDQVARPWRAFASRARTCPSCARWRWASCSGCRWRCSTTRVSAMTSTRTGPTSSTSPRGTRCRRWRSTRPPTTRRSIT